MAILSCPTCHVLTCHILILADISTSLHPDRLGINYTTALWHHWVLNRNDTLYYGTLFSCGCYVATKAILGLLWAKKFVISHWCDTSRICSGESMAHETAILWLLETGSLLWFLITRQSVSSWNRLIFAICFATEFLFKYSILVIDWRALLLLYYRLLLLSFFRVLCCRLLRWQVDRIK